ncbi:DNA ligase 1 [Helicoverpa armigera]|uniref:DNA ligase 1 n=1 Tax=Helicoverpa armigera TaxID=29058 RepID=UPI0021119D41|nr:DNA ligase 1 [Helicoverpa armigera]
MARALLLALTCAAAASATRYVDYSGVKMPAYGSGSDYEAPRDPVVQPSDDYRGHSPDAPASPDYKYEEEPRIKTEKPTKDTDDSEVWRKPGRKQRGLVRPPDSAVADVVSKFDRDEEDAPKFRLSHRFPKHRSRLKNELPARDDESPRRPVKYSRDRKDDVSDIDRKDYFHVDKDDFPDDKSKEFDDEGKFANEATTRRGNRRKPRDRHIKRKSSDLDSSYEDDLDLDRRLKVDSDKEVPRRTRPPDDRAVERPAERIAERLGDRPGDFRAHERFRSHLDEDEEDLTKAQPVSKSKPKTYEDYDDYYDMKRVYNIKNKLPSLLRRTTEKSRAPTPTSYLDMLWNNRRIMAPEVLTDDEFLHDVSRPVTAKTRPRTRATRPPTTTPYPTTLELMSTTPETTTTTTPPTTTTTTTTTSTTSTTSVSTTTVNATALSLAEKSRLSILKKDQRKEGQHVEPHSKKPPVLLQVTRHMPTVVMVEPPSSELPWMRAKELSEDSPERLEKVKKMMRQKLVADAKSIHDLTDHWDDMVCDYVDVGLLDDAAHRPRPTRTAHACTLAAIACAVMLFI